MTSPITGAQALNEINESQIRLMAGELSRDEVRAVLAVLKGLSPFYVARPEYYIPPVAEPVALEKFRQALIKRGRPTYGSFCSRDVDVAADIELYDAAIACVVPTPMQSGAQEALPLSARLLANQVLAMDLATPKGLRARQLARQVLDGSDTMLLALRLIEHATQPSPDDDAYHEAAHDIASQTIAKVASALSTTQAKAGEAG